MRLLKCTILLGILLLIYACVYAQQKEVDSLNELAFQYAKTQVPANWDTARTYIQRAYKKAVTLNYTKGIGDAVFNSAFMEMNRQNFPVSEQLFRKSTSYYSKVSYTAGVAWSHFNLGYTLYTQARFDEAITEFENANFHFSNCHSECEEGIPKTYEFLAVTYALKGELLKGLELAQKGLEESQQRNDSLGMALPLMIMGELYQSMDDPKTALEYYYASAALDTCADLYVFLQMGVVHNTLQQYDSALFYQQKAFARDPNNRFMHIVLGEIYTGQKRYSQALQLFNEVVLFIHQNNERKELLRVLPDIAQVYIAQKDYHTALRYAQQGLVLAQTTGARQYKAKNLKLLSDIYSLLGVENRSLFYLQQYFTLKDSLLNDQFKARLFAYKSTVDNEKKQAQIEWLKNEKQITQQQLEIQQQKLQQDILLKRLLTGGLAAFALLGFVLFRNLSLKRKNEKLRNERIQASLLHKTIELEMQALRAQMNPHFIFNSLNFINRFILQHNKEQASDYLSKFSRLVRLILQNSKESFVSLESELEALQLYLELEALRFDQHFDYYVHVDSNLDEGELKVPPLLIQPFAENAIWHGLMHKEDKGLLQIDIFSQKESLVYRITDNGIGRKKAAELKNRHSNTYRSMGMQITADRITLLQQQQLVATSIQINDLVLPDGSVDGTEVEIKLPIIYD